MKHQKIETQMEPIAREIMNNTDYLLYFFPWRLVDIRELLREEGNQNVWPYKSE